MIHVNSEIGTLKKVLVHRPDHGIGLIAPGRAEELLFDDIVHLPTMQAEHDIFSKILKAFLGEDNVYEVQNLLKESIASSDTNKTHIIEKVIDFERLPSSSRALFLELTDEELAETLISGYVASKDHVVFDPIPNYIFTRDIAVTIKDHIIVTKAAKEARSRENILTWFIMNHHPLFEVVSKEGRLINLNDIEVFAPSKNGEKVSIEGGDIMMLADNYVLIGRSERTTAHAIHSIKEVIFEKNLVDNVVQINIPDRRSCMHIDTLFTRVSDKDVAAFKPIVYDGESSDVVVYNKDGGKTVYGSVRAFFEKEIDADTNFVFSGSAKSPFQEREQWTDSCNLLTIKSGVAIAYDRNPLTDKAFEEAGYALVRAEDLLNDIHSGKVAVEEVERTIILLPSNELSRARGGSHCMSCPISRESV